MSNTNLSLNFNSPTTSNFFILPLFFNYANGVQVRLLLTATKPDSNNLLASLDQIFNQPSISVEDFYQVLDELVHPKRPFRHEVTLTAVFIDSDHSILVFTFGGSVILRRGDKAGVLAAGNGSESVAKAGNLKVGDSLVLFNSPSPVLTKPLVENLEQAQSWTDFSLFGQAFLAQADFENLGFYLIKQSILDIPEPEKISRPVSRVYEPTVPSAIAEDEEDNDDGDDEDEEPNKMGFFTLIKSKVPFFNKLGSKNKSAADDDEEEYEDYEQPLESNDINIFQETEQTTVISRGVSGGQEPEYYSTGFTAGYSQRSSRSDLGSIDRPEDDADNLPPRRFSSPSAGAAETDDFNLDKLDDIYRRRS